MVSRSKTLNQDTKIEHTFNLIIDNKNLYFLNLLNQMKLRYANLRRIILISSYQ